jgi:hypothetical protein
MRSDCEAFVKGCVLCSVLKTKNEGRVIVGTPRVVSQPRKSWMIDQVTGLPPIEGFSSYLTLVDLFSGYCTAYPLKKGTSEEIAKILEENIIRNFGAPNEILSDNAANLNGPAIKKLLDFYGIKHVFSTPYSPTSHSLVEIQNKLITQLLKIFAEQYRTGWYHVLTLAVNIVNTVPRVSLLNHTPAFLMFGDENNEPNTVQNSILDMEENVRRKQNNKNFAKLVRHYLLLCRKHRNARVRAKTLSYPVGSLVYLKDFSQIVNRKMKNIYKRTPYKVIGEYLNTVYIIDIFGRVSRHSKNNIRKVGERSERLFGALPQDIKLLLGDAMTPEIWDQIKESKLVPEYLQAMEADFVEPRKTRQSLPHDTHLLEKREAAEPDPDPAIDPDEYLDPFEDTTFEKIVTLHRQGALDDENIDIADIDPLYEKMFPSSPIDKEENRIPKLPQGINVENILSSRTRSGDPKVQFEEQIGVQEFVPD